MKTNCKFITELDVDTGINWWNKARIEVNKIIREFNQWQIDGFHISTREGEIGKYAYLQKVERLIEYGKQTITKDSEIAHELLDEMESFVISYRELNSDD